MMSPQTQKILKNSMQPILEPEREEDRIRTPRALNQKIE